MDEFLRQLVLEAGERAKEFFLTDLSVRTKSNPADLVTEADHAVSDFIINRIQDRYPGHGIVSEERSGEINSGAEYRWVIDPIDGTRNFAMGIPSWCVMVALVRGGQAIMGAINHPVANQLFQAERGKGALMNGSAIKVNPASSAGFFHSLAVIANDREHGVEQERFQRAVIGYLENTNGWLQNHGTIFPACHVGRGGIDFYASNAGYDYDYLAASVICSEAGAIVTDIDGRPWQPGRRDFIVATPLMHPKVMELFGRP